jgi:hypothetical protein
MVSSGALAPINGVIANDDLELISREAAPEECRTPRRRSFCLSVRREQNRGLMQSGPRCGIR